MKGIKVACDYDIWLPVPSDWPWEDYLDVKEWATRVGDAFTEAYGWDLPARQWCIDAVTSLSTGTDDEEWRHVYIDPQARWMYGVSVFWHDKRDDETLDDLAGSDDPAAVRAPERTVFSTPYLGVGVRSLRYVNTGAPKNEIVGILQFGFSADGANMMVLASTYDLALHEEMMPLVDEFVRTISVVEG